MKKLILLLSCISLFAYQWPMKDKDGNPDNQKISSTFGEYRSGHFHEGIDIPPQPNADTDTLYIWPIDYGIVVDINTYYVRIQHYDASFSSAKDEGSGYIHAYVRGVCGLGEQMVLDNPVARGWDFEDSTYAPHLHLELRMPGDLTNSKNPFFISELLVNDTNPPTLHSVYVDYSLYGNANVENWEYLGSNFEQYYSIVYDTTGGDTFVALYLPAETPSNDWDDPHIIISGNRKIRFTVKAWDTPNTANVCGPYTVKMYIDDNIYALSGDTDSLPIYKVQFDSLINTGSPDKYEEEDVYHTEKPIPSGMGMEKYYRLYPHDDSANGLPAVIGTGNRVLQTENLEEGQHMIRIIATDWNGYQKTGDFHIYIRKSEWVDYSRSFHQ